MNEQDFRSKTLQPLTPYTIEYLQNTAAQHKRNVEVFERRAKEADIELENGAAWAKAFGDIQRENMKKEKAALDDIALALVVLTGVFK